MISALCACATNQVSIQGIYVHEPTGGFIVFQRDGSFFYSLSAPQSEKRDIPANTGKYIFQNNRDLEPHHILRAAHTGMFRFLFNEDRTQLTVDFLLTEEKTRVYLLQQE